MIATIQSDCATDDVQLRFLVMLPMVRRAARCAFRGLGREAREDAVAEVVANSFAAFARLVTRGKVEFAFATVLARYAIRQFHSGRRVGNRLNSRDVLSAIRRRRGLAIERIDQIDAGTGGWTDAVVEDSCTPVADQAAFRCDFPAWLQRHSRRKRRIAVALSLGNTTADVAKKFGVSPGRVSQIRAELHGSWLRFHGEAAALA